MAGLWKYFILSPLVQCPGTSKLKKITCPEHRYLSDSYLSFHHKQNGQIKGLILTCTFWFEFGRKKKKNEEI